MRAAIRIDDPGLAAAARGLCQLAGLTECPEDELRAGDLLLLGEDPAEAAAYAASGIRAVLCAEPLSFRDLWERLRGTGGEREDAPPKRGRAPEPEEARERGPAGERDPIPAADGKTRTVRCGGRSAVLTPREFALFACLARHAGETVSRETLLAEAWAGADPKPAANAPDVTVGYVRRRLAPLFGDGAILSRRGEGYVWTGGEVGGIRKAE